MVELSRGPAGGAEGGKRFCLYKVLRMKGRNCTPGVARVVDQVCSLAMMKENG